MGKTASENVRLRMKITGGARSLQEVLRTLANPLQRTPIGITVHQIPNVRGTTSLAPTLVKAEVNLTTGATLDPPGTTAALLLRRWSR